MIRPPRRVLADYHHADAYESLLILFEDRFGWEVYRPTGRDWVAAGLWRISDDPRNERSLLDPLPGQVLAGDHHEAPQVGNPARRHKLVTAAQFRALSWDFVLASVGVHEHSWQRLADQVGARAILRVGTVQQPVDWSLPHVVLAAARIDLRGPGVLYHPEFSRAEFRYEPPAGATRILNGMNYLSGTPSAYEDWLSLQAALPAFEFREHGLGGRDGHLTPPSALAAAMRAASWGFHVKPIGDAYGFVVHQWAAVGRPLIGRARYYAGLLAEPLWADGVTAIDLDAPGAIERIRAVAGDPAGHRTMCEAMADRFRALVDFDAEAEQIRALLDR